MADLNVAIDMLGRDQASGPIQSVVSALGGLTGAATSPIGVLGHLTDSFGGLVTGFGAFGLAAMGVNAAFGAVSGAVSGLISDAQNAQQVQAQLNSVLTSTHGAAGVSAQAVNQLSDNLSQLTPFEDEAITSAQSMLLTFTNIGSSVFPKATETVLDMSQALGEDLQSSSIQLGKALNDPINGITALQRVGVTFNESQKETIKTMVESGNVAGAQGVILNELQTEFGGAAKAAGETFGGQLKILGTNLGNVKEAIFTPVLAGFGEALHMVNAALLDSGFQDALPKIGGFLADLAQRGISLAAEGFAGLVGIVTNVTNVFSEMFDALSHGDFTGALNILFTSVSSVFTNILDTVDSFAKSMFGAGYNLISELAGGIISGASSAIQGAIDYVANLIASFFVGFSPPPKGPLSEIDKAGENLMATFAGGMAEGLSPVEETALETQTIFEHLNLSIALKDGQEGLAKAGVNLNDLKEASKEVEGSIKDIDKAIHQLDESSSKLKFTISEIKFDLEDQLRPLNDQLALLKDQRDFGADQKDLQFQLREVELKRQEIGARGNKDAEKNIKSQLDSLRLEKDSFDLTIKQEQLQRKIQALPIEQQIANVKAEHEKILSPLQRQLDILQRQKDELGNQKQLWQSLKSDIDEAVKAGTPKGGGGGGGAKGGGGGINIPKPAAGALPDVSKLGDTFKSKALEVGDKIGQNIQTGLSSYLQKNLAPAISGGLGAILGAAALGPVGLAAGAFLGTSFGQSLITAFAARGVDFNKVVSDTFTRIGTFVQSLGGMDTLATAVNKAFGDLIPADLNAKLDAVDKAFATVKATVLGLVSDFQQGGLAAIWNDITTAMSAFAPTGERIQEVIKAIQIAVSALIPQPLQDFVTSLLNLATGAASAGSPLQALATVVNTVSGAIEDVVKTGIGIVQFFRDSTLAGGLLVAAVTAIATAWTLSTAALAAQNAGLLILAARLAITEAATGAMALAQGALNVVLDANPIGLTIVALAALTAGLIYAYNNSETFRKTVDTAFAVLKEAVSGAIQVATTLLGGFGSLVNATGGILTGFQQLSQQTWAAIGQFIQGTMSNIGTFISNGWQQASSYISESYQSISSFTSETWSNISSFIGNTMSAIGSTIQTWWSNAVSSTSTLLSNIVSVVQTRWANAQTNVSTVMAAIQKFISDSWDAISTVVSTVMGTITGLIQAGFDTINTVVGTIMGTVTTTITDAWEAVRAAVEEKVGAALALVKGWGKELGEYLGTLKDTLLTEATNIGTSIVGGIRAGIEGAWNALKEFAVQLVRDLLSSMKAAIKPGSPSHITRDEIGIPIVQGVSAGMQQELPKALIVASASAQAIIEAFNGSPGSVSYWESIGANIGKGIFGVITHMVVDNTADVIGGIEKFKGDVSRAFGGLSTYIQGWIAEVAAKRTELLRIFNYAAYLRGEGTKVIPELEDLTRTFIQRSTEAAQEAGSKLQQIAKELQDNIKAARDDAQKAADEAVAAAAKQVQQLQFNAALQKEVQAQKDAFTQMQANQKEFFDASQAELQRRLSLQESIAKINYEANAKLSALGQGPSAVDVAQQELDARTETLRIDYEQQRDVARATTEDQKAEINKRALDAHQALQDRIDEETYLANQTKELRLNVQREQIEAERAQALQALQNQQAEDIAIAQQTFALREEIAQREFLFNQEVRRQQDVFEASMDAAAMQRQINTIYAERDERIKSIQQALEAKEQALQDAAAKERADVIENLEAQLKDYKEKYIDGVVQAFHNAQVDIVDFVGLINDQLKKQADAVNDNVLRMIKNIADAKQTLGDMPQFIPQEQAPVPSPIYPVPYSPESPIISALPNETRRVNIVNNITTTQPVTAQQITNETNRSVLLSGIL